MIFDIDALVRPNIKRAKVYSSARHEFSGSKGIFLNANENAFGSPVGPAAVRYPDPFQTRARQAVAGFNGIDPRCVFMSSGSDEAIDLLFRVFCEPGRDNVVVCPPTYGMYEVSASINDVEVREAPLGADLELDADAIRRAADERTKLIFICSPNNPTGNALSRDTIIRLARSSGAIVVVDEAYQHFSSAPSLIGVVTETPNLVVLQTFSKAWGMADARVGLAFADERIISLLDRIKPPYNVPGFAQDLVIEAIENSDQMLAKLAAVIDERRRLSAELSAIGIVEKVYRSDANFLLVKVRDAGSAYTFLINRGIVVRDRSSLPGCKNCLRMTVGLPDENDALINALKEYENSIVH